ncbi:unnamed protein product [Pleuronectes platessa]|uniref:Uncharacterized protein n=1 Tax=Pleuronectes platessa TaxID=8262 RepID=A0A9N7VD86_PLEPL|nr:unnamed protein product [Pleuronectes platessa]
MQQSKNAAGPQNSSDPEDSEASLHHLHFYRVPKSSADVSDTQSELISVLTAVWAADMKIAPRKSKPSSGAARLQSPPITYMHICETEVFSMGGSC